MLVNEVFKFLVASVWKSFTNNIAESSVNTAITVFVVVGISVVHRRYGIDPSILFCGISACIESNDDFAFPYVTRNNLNDFSERHQLTN